MSKIVSIGTAVPAYCHRQMDILSFMQTVYALPPDEARKLRFMYAQSGIENRYSVLADYSRQLPEWKFYPQGESLEPFPSLEQRMSVYTKQAPLLSVDAIRDCLSHHFLPQNITHLITVSCTGMSAPGLDLQVMELMDLKKTIFRTSVNFMGCYAAIHALKIADAICKSEKEAQVLIVCTELCTLHFQKEGTMDNMASSLLFGDGSSAALVMNNEASHDGLFIDNFYSEINPKGKRDMAWELSSSGFLMTLSGYIPELIEEDFAAIVERALQKSNHTIDDVTHWCVHPGGKKILQAIHKSLHLANGELQCSYDILKQFGNLSSATILFVLKTMLQQKDPVKKLFGAAFGPGLTVQKRLPHTLKATNNAGIASFTLWPIPLTCCMPSFKQRSYKKELLDSTDIPFRDIKRNMQELDFINRHLGGHDITLDGIVKLIQNTPILNKQLKIVEIGCGGGDNLRAIKNWAAHINLPVALLGVDINSECINFAESQERNHGIAFVHSDYRLTSFEVKADIVFSSLFCHHFTNEELVELLKWMNEKSAIGFFINDLHRHPLAYYSIKTLTQVFSRSYLVKNDAPLSVLRGFKRADWQKLFDEAGIEVYECTWRWAFRWLITCETHED